MYINILSVGFTCNKRAENPTSYNNNLLSNIEEKEYNKFQIRPPSALGCISLGLFRICAPGTTFARLRKLYQTTERFAFLFGSLSVLSVPSNGRPPSQTDETRSTGHFFVLRAPAVDLAFFCCKFSFCFFVGRAARLHLWCEGAIGSAN